jgi:hypothetical protein
MWKTYVKLRDLESKSWARMKYRHQDTAQTVRTMQPLTYKDMSMQDVKAWMIDLIFLTTVQKILLSQH